MDPALFHQVTPREMAVIMAGAADRIRREQGLTYSLAQLVSYSFHRPKEMPRFDRVFPRAKARAQSETEIYQALQAWAADHNKRLAAA